jgi:hypothetical protein
MTAGAEQSELYIQHSLTRQQHCIVGTAHDSKKTAGSNVRHLILDLLFHS